MGIQVRSNKGPCSFPRADDSIIAKLIHRNLKIFLSTTESIGGNSSSNEGPRIFPQGDNIEKNY